MAQIIRPRKIGISALKTSILNTALTTHYECWFNPPDSIRSLISEVEKDENYTLSCLEASLPGTSLATVELKNDHSGITERHVNRRQYDTTASFTFYVDRYYRQLQLFETWIGYIVNEVNRQDEGYFYRVNFPTDYQTSIWITKFERDFNKPQKENENYDEQQLTYLFLNAYPISIDAMPISYEGAQTLKCTVNFNFSRYISGATHYPQNADGTGVAPYPLTDKGGLAKDQTAAFAPSVEDVEKAEENNKKKTTSVTSHNNSSNTTENAITQEQVESVSFYDENGNYIGDQLP